jgi:predicted enzyme related to lactoylglutathione lyase
VDAAAKFYTGLFNWTSRTLTRDTRTYVLLEYAGRPVAGIVQRPVNGAVTGARPARWVGYVAVADVARTAAAVTAAGGKVLAPAREFPRRGTQAIVADPEGAVLGLLQSASGDPPDYQPESGEWIWAELLSPQPQNAAAWYGRLLGYKVTDASSPGGRQHFTLGAGGFARAGVMALPGEGQEAPPPSWLGFVRVDSAEATAARAATLGGRVIVPPRTSHFGTPFAVIADPTGAVLAVIEFKAAAEAAPPR